MSLLFPVSTMLRKLGEFWYESIDGDVVAKEIFDRHYSRYRYADGRVPKLFVGPGEKLVMLTANSDGLFIWRKFISGNGQQGVNCAVFRNESTEKSSDLILDADAIAWRQWPGVRLYTYVNSDKVKSTNPGCCFKKAGWRQCGITKVNRLLIFEKFPTV